MAEDVSIDATESGSEHRLRTTLKFGGTVCGKLPEQVIRICSSALLNGPIAVVCSARSGKTKVEGTTNLLLKAAREAWKSGAAEYASIINVVLNQHQEATAILSPKRAAALAASFEQECKSLNSLLAEIRSLQRKRDSNTREAQGIELQSSLESCIELEDEIMGVGEKLSAQFMAALLEDRGTPAQYIDLSNAVSRSIGDHSGNIEHVFSELSSVIRHRVVDCGPRVPVITGYFGKIRGGLLKDCGRGYSDILAAIVSGSTASKELQIWKEVRGVFTADPSKVPTAKLLSSIQPSEARELTFYGSEVIHHLTIDECKRHQIPIRIKNVREPDHAGTVIRSDFLSKRTSIFDSRPQKPTAVTVKDLITVVNVHSNHKTSSGDFLERICRILRQQNLSVDLFELNETHVSLAVHSKTPFITMRGKRDTQEVAMQHQHLHSAILELQDLGVVEVQHNMAILSLIGIGLKHSYGLAGKFFSALGNNFINIEIISQGASEINISCVIQQRDALRALNIVHTELFTFLE